MITTPAARIAAANDYLNARTGCYEWRCHRYDAAIDAMINLGLIDVMPLIVDVGAGRQEFRARLVQRNISAAYIAHDAAIDGIDFDDPSYEVGNCDFVVCLEVLEHLINPRSLMDRMITAADKAVIVSTPNPATTDVLGMDTTHQTPITRSMLERKGFYVQERSFYGQPADSLFGVWSPDGQ